MVRIDLLLNGPKEKQIFPTDESTGSGLNIATPEGMASKTIAKSLGVTGTL